MPRPRPILRGARRRTVLRLTLVVLLAAAVVAGWLHWRRTAIPRWLQAHDEKLLLPAIDEVATRHGLPPMLLRALVWKESRFNQFSVGKKGEIGLMQITDGAVKDWAERNHVDVPSRFDRFIPEINLEIGAWYLEQAYRHWAGYASQDILALAEYNAGYRRVRTSWAPENPEAPLELSGITFPGTRQYVAMILERRRHYENGGE